MLACHGNTVPAKSTVGWPYYTTTKVHPPLLQSNIATNFPPGVLTFIKMADKLSKLITDSEHVHQRVRRTARSTDIDKRFPDFRFNVERDVGDIGLEEWRMEEEMAAHTMAYLHKQEVGECKMECVEYLVNPPEFKRIKQNW